MAYGAFGSRTTKAPAGAEPWWQCSDRGVMYGTRDCYVSTSPSSSGSEMIREPFQSRRWSALTHYLGSDPLDNSSRLPRDVSHIHQVFASSRHSRASAERGQDPGETRLRSFAPRHPTAHTRHACRDSRSPGCGSGELHPKIQQGQTGWPYVHSGVLLVCGPCRGGAGHLIHDRGGDTSGLWVLSRIRQLSY